MTARRSGGERWAFELETRTMSFETLKPLKIINARVKSSKKYEQIVASVTEVGLIEPPVVTPDPAEAGTYFILDGHVRVEILKDQGASEVPCLIATDDEAFTYNRRVNRLATIQEHKMILTAIRKGVPEERLARALSVNIFNIRSKRRLLDGVCAEATDILKDKQVPVAVFHELRRLKAMRQIEAADLMRAMNNYSTSYMKSIVAASPPSQMVEPKKKSATLTGEQIALMESEAGRLERDFKVIEQDYGSDHLDLVLATGYVTRLLDDAPVVGHLAKHHPEILSEFQRLVELQKAA